MAISCLSDINFERVVDFQSTLLLDGNSGILNQVLQSQGPDLPPVWSDGGSGIDPVIAGMIF